MKHSAQNRTLRMVIDSFFSKRSQEVQNQETGISLFQDRVILPGIIKFAESVDP
jgi:hypothetical protein